MERKQRNFSGLIHPKAGAPGFRRGRALALAAALGVGLVAGCHSKTVNDYLSDGNAAMQKTELPQAEQSYQAAAKAAPWGSAGSRRARQPVRLRAEARAGAGGIYARARTRTEQPGCPFRAGRNLRIGIANGRGPGAVPAPRSRSSRPTPPIASSSVRCSRRSTAADGPRLNCARRSGCSPRTRRLISRSRIC